MTASLFVPPRTVSISASSHVRAGAKRFFYLAGTNTEATVYTSAAKAATRSQPVVATSGGEFPACYVDVPVKVSEFTSADALLWTEDNIPLTGASTQEVGQAIHPETSYEASVTITDYTYPPGDARRYGYVANGSTDNSLALAAALAQMAAGGAPVILPPGTGRFSASLNIPTKGVIRGAGKERTILQYTGSAQAFKQATPTARIYEILVSDFSLYDVGTGTVGLDMAAVSTSVFERLWIDGFTTGVRLHSPTSGYSVYNRFFDVTTNGGASTVGFKLSGTSANANLFIGCRANGSSVTSSRGWEITDGNGNQIIGCHPEGLGDAIYITATGAGLAPGNVIMANRIEGCTTGVNIASANVEHTRVIQNHYTINTTDIADSGTRSIIDDPIVYPSRFVWPSTVDAIADGTVRWVRDAEGGSSLPFVVFRDSASAAGTPVTVQIETERAAGSFITGKRGGNVLMDVKANGVFYCGVLTVATLPTAADHDFYRAIVTDALAKVFGDPVAAGGALVVPVYSNGTNWLIG